MSKNVITPKRSVLRKTLKVIWRTYYYATALVGVLVCVFAFRIWFGTPKPYPTSGISNDQEKSSLVLTPSNNEPVDVLEPIDDESENDDLSETVDPK